MYLVDGTVVTSASDLKKASECEFAFLRELDVKLGRDTLFEPVADAMLERSGRMGDAHEHRVLEAYRAQLGSAVVEIERPDVRNAAAVQAAVEATQAAFAAGAPVVFQATFADEGFIGFADFIVRQPDGRYLVQDSKLARRVRSGGRPRRPGRRRRPARRRSARDAPGAAGRRARCRRGGARWSTRRRAAVRPCRRTARRRAGAARRRPRAGGAP